MTKYLLLTLFFSLISNNLLAQEGKDSISVLKNELEAFKYSQVIDHADLMIRHKETLSKATLVEVYRMKATAQFSLSDIEGAKSTFNDILNIDSTYVLDPSNTSPKIISYFNQVKQNFKPALSPAKLNFVVKTDTIIIPDKNSSLVLKQAVIRSVIFPGLGHFYLNESAKGVVFSSLTAAALTSMIYFIIDSNKKQSTYLNAQDDITIQSGYSDYNTSYKLRNISIISLAAIWLYSQVDLLFFTSNNLPVVPGMSSSPSGKLQMSFQFEL